MRMRSILSPERYRKLRALYHSSRAAYVRRFRAFGPGEVRDALASMGVRHGDCLMLHSGFARDTGFTGTVESFTDSVLDAVGQEGTLVMPTLSYRNAAIDYLGSLDVFDVRRTPSMMGLVSEFFRRRDGVLRSLNPMHPVAAKGSRAAWLVEGHEHAVHSCGPNTPWSKLLELDAKVAFFATSFAAFTFFHHIEDIVSPKLPFPLYADPPFDIPVIDQAGEKSVVRIHAFSREAIRRRRFPVFENELRRQGLIKTRRLGNTQLEIVSVRDAARTAENMIDAGRYFHEVTAGAPGPGTQTHEVRK
jgi:aminoglycoside 3-N-acetyltransferase